ncbi:EmrB/QacA subfamily drug resistance transporter [Motilibacter peucedani]|uniref:EmrB/QacA subfamily drug resistance transporter n=1 Tax=Motilibacter peucedani TaxID=598650 RepID=A0A420XR22_9ACTN|nr:MFS transporter [Motilibacter peucedani]RKS75697.1 EmrB/QacA subfamily drug resistance transporter [Motilibacter peucedani]
MTATGATGAGDLAYASAPGRWVLLATVLGSGMVFLDGTVVNVALRPIGSDLDAGLSALQWVVNGYTLALASLILLGGSLGDRFGRRRVFVVGTVWFAGASLLCGLAPDPSTLIAFRVLQGIGGALLTPGSLAILQTAFRHEDRARAIGAWSGLAGLASAAGPVLGGWLVGQLSWRWAFLINVPFALAVVLVSVRHVPESRDAEAAPHLDGIGAGLGALGLGATTYALIAWPDGGADALDVAAAVVGVAAMVAFVLRERTARFPMLPLGLFRSRTFSAANLATFAIYGGLGGVFLLLVLELQVVDGFSPLKAGSMLLPLTAVMLLVSARMGGVVNRIGPRWPMTVGSLVAGTGVVLMSRLPSGGASVPRVLLMVAVVGLGMSVLVAPLTASVLGSVEDRFAGVASGTNNAVSRAAGLLAVAALPALVGLTGDEYADPHALHPAYQHATLICAGLFAAGALVSLVGVPDVLRAHPVDAD